jgi:flagellar biosynthesis/type III secretory pathway M-ring protein FliF/YscJ
MTLTPLYAMLVACFFVTVIKLSGADAEAEAFAERMRTQLQRKRKLAQAAASSKSEDLDVGGEEERLRKAEMQRKIQEKVRHAH